MRENTELITPHQNAMMLANTHDFLTLTSVKPVPSTLIDQITLNAHRPVIAATEQHMKSGG